MTLDRLHSDVSGSSSDAMGFAACQLAARLGARAIVASVRTMMEAMILPASGRRYRL